jgi:hypothetical protein
LKKDPVLLKDRVPGIHRLSSRVRNVRMPVMASEFHLIVYTGIKK